MLRIEPLAPRIGALVTGVDVNRVTDQEWGRIYQAWLDWHVLVIRDQHFTLEQYLAFSRRFGRVKPHFVRKTRHPQFPEITLMGTNKKTTAGVNEAIYHRGEGWHTDSPYDAEVCKATLLYGLELPSIGGDTAFSNMYAVYEALPDALKARIEHLRGWWAYGGGAAWRVALLDRDQQVDVPAAVHRIVRRHPETGRKALYINPIEQKPHVNPDHQDHIVGLAKADSDALLNELYSYMLQPGCQYQHRWQVGDVVTWDNRCTVHSAIGGYPLSENRIHWRTTVMDPAESMDELEPQAA